MNKNYGVIIHPERFDDLLNMTCAEAGCVVQNMIRTFRGEDIKVFDDRYLDYVSNDLCERVKWDKELSERRSASGKRGAEAKGKQTVSKSVAKGKQDVSVNIKVKDNINNNIGFKPNAFTSGCTNSPIDFDELEKTLIKNQ